MVHRNGASGVGSERILVLAVGVVGATTPAKMFSCFLRNAVHVLPTDLLARLRLLRRAKKTTRSRTRPATLRCPPPPSALSPALPLFRMTHSPKRCSTLACPRHPRAGTPAGSAGSTPPKTCRASWGRTTSRPSTSQRGGGLKAAAAVAAAKNHPATATQPRQLRSPRLTARSL